MVIPLHEPESFIKGDTVKWRRKFPDYAPATWTLSYNFVTAKDQKTVTATDNSDGTHLITITAAESAKYANGDYHFQASVTDGSDRYTVAEGVIESRENFASVQGYDARNYWEQVLEALRAAYLDSADSDQSSMSIGGRSISMMTKEEMRQAIGHAENKVRQQRDAERISAGRGARKIMVQM